MKNSAKVSFIIAFLLILFILVITCIGFVACIRAYTKSDIEYSDLQCEELMFVRLERIYGSKGSSWYKLYFNGYSEYFGISSYAMKYVNHDKMEALTENDTVSVYFKNDDENYEICEISTTDTVIFSLDDYIGATKSNLMIGIIFCPIMVLNCIFILLFFVRKYKIFERYKSER